MSPTFLPVLFSILLSGKYPLKHLSILQEILYSLYSISSRHKGQLAGLVVNWKLGQLSSYFQDWL